jgi:hypothetical protein
MLLCSHAHVHAFHEWAKYVVEFMRTSSTQARSKLLPSGSEVNFALIHVRLHLLGVQSYLSSYSLDVDVHSDSMSFQHECVSSVSTCDSDSERDPFA